MKPIVDSKRLRFLAHMGARGCLGEAIYNLADENPHFSVISADLAIASGFQRFISEYPKRFLNVGIAEQNMIGVAAGMADEGHPVIATSWGAFASYRCADQIRNYLGIMRSNVKIIGMDSGITISRFGACHYALGDIALLRAIPNIVIFSPCDGIEICQAVEAALSITGPVYIRLTGGQRLPLIHRSADYRFEPGKAETLALGRDVAIIGTGVVIEHCMKTAAMLNDEGISCSVFNMSTLKPLDHEIASRLNDYRLVVTVEEHSEYGGLGSAVSELIASSPLRPKQLIIGVGDMNPPTGTYEFLLRHCGLCADQIMRKITQAMEDEI